jgi:hypothetical protein
MNSEAARFLVESGLLFEINRRVLHPLGLWVQFSENLGGEFTNNLILGQTNDPEGRTFAEEDLEEGLTRLRRFMNTRGYARLTARYDRLGYRTQVPADADPNADERDWTVPRRELTAAARDVVETARGLVESQPRFIVQIENRRVTEEEIDRLRLRVQEADGDAGKMEEVVQEFNLDERRISASRVEKDVTEEIDDLRAALEALDAVRVEELSSDLDELGKSDK